MKGIETTVLAAVTVACVVANAGIAIADFAKAPSVLANSAEVGVAPRWIPHLTALKLAGAVGVHVRTKVFHNIAFPSTFLVLAAGAFGYFVTVLA